MLTFSSLCKEFLYMVLATLLNLLRCFLQIVNAVLSIILKTLGNLTVTFSIYFLYTFTFAD